MILLAVDASTYRGTVAVVRDRAVVASTSVAMKDPQHERLMPAVADCLEQAGCSPAEVDGVICGAGPGSFTSLRIAAGIAKGFAMARGCPLYAVSSLALIVAEASLGPGRYVAVIDALRGEQYVAAYERSSDALRALGSTRLVATADVADLAAEQGARVVGPGAAMLGGMDIAPDAASVAPLLAGVLESGPVDLASWEPRYGRLAEAQVKWEAAHGRALSTSA